MSLSKRRISPLQPQLLPSLLDRLIAEPTASDAPSQQPNLADIKANIRRDLEWMLNTRAAQPEHIGRYPELLRSLLNYGLPDFNNVLLGSEEHRLAFRAEVQAAIERLEPRLRRIQVELSPAGTEHDRTLHLTIAALLMVEPEPIPLLFDSKIGAADRAVRLREIDHG